MYEGEKVDTLCDMFYLFDTLIAIYFITVHLLQLRPWRHF